VFAWHPVLMVSGMVVCSTEALLAFRTFGLGKPINKAIHLGFQTLAIILLRYDWAIIYSSKPSN
jgi:hypothetical protein